MSAAIRSMQNRSFFHGDNLPFLRALPAASIHLTATDPLFNKKRNFYSGGGAGSRAPSNQSALALLPPILGFAMPFMCNILLSHRKAS